MLQVHDLGGRCVNDPLDRPPMSLLHYRLLLFALAAVVAAGMGLDLMEVDAAQYAAMAREMLERKDYLHLYHRGQDYLDKPPLLF